ncbi:MAG: hypothetical protein HRT86_09420 [Ilumatobacteraceae bacterium]|nr:hypothetical protein [Ilumatobacteraceae bacterium]
MTHWRRAYPAAAVSVSAVQMSDRDPGQVLQLAAERLDALADVAELMGDGAGADRFRADANRRRLEAMELLDD